MPTRTFIALLRGVNVGGKTLKMDLLRSTLGELGCRDVRTYLQSGNAVFSSSATAKSLTPKIEAALAEVAGFPITVVLRMPDDLAALLAKNPFVGEAGVDEARLYVTFLASAPSGEGIKKLAAIKAGDDRFIVDGHDVFLHCPDGYGNSKLANPAIERAFGVRATTRNWNTVNALHRMGLE